MKGIIFNLVERIVRQEYGEDAWDALLEKSGAAGAYTTLGNYPDRELNALVDAAAATWEIMPDEVYRWLGLKALPLLAQLYPRFLEAHANTRSFLLTLNSVIHPEVRKLYPGADVPVFTFDTSSAEVLVVRYTSARRLCAFAEGLIQGAAEHFHEGVAMEHTQCLRRGDRRCAWNISFTTDPGSAHAGAVPAVTPP